MKKEQVLVFACSLASVGVFWLAIEMWLCGDDASCRQNNQIANNIAGAAINVNVPGDPYGNGWSGPAYRNFNIQATGSSDSVVYPIVVPTGGSQGGGYGDGDAC